MKAHSGVDKDSGAVHSVHGTAANESDVAHAHAVLHGEETDVHADAGYVGIEKRAEHAGRDVVWHIAAKRGSIRKLPEGEEKAALQ